MRTPIVMPKLGYEVESATLVNWTKQVGDRVAQGDVIAEVDAAKGTAEVEAPVAGVLTEILCEPGREVPAGTVIGYLDDSV